MRCQLSSEPEKLGEDKAHDEDAHSVPPWIEAHTKVLRDIKVIRSEPTCHRKGSGWLAGFIELLGEGDVAAVEAPPPPLACAFGVVDEELAEEGGHAPRRCLA